MKICKKEIPEDDLEETLEFEDSEFDEEEFEESGEYSVLEDVFVRFNFDSVISELNPEVDLSIDNSDIQEEFARQPKLAAGYGYLFALAEAEESKKDFQLDVIHSKLSKEVRIKITKEGRKVTEKLVEAEILLTDQYKRAKMAHIDAQKHKRVYKAAQTAIEHKLQGLISAGASQRFNQSPVIKKMKMVSKEFQNSEKSIKRVKKWQK